MCHTVSNLSTKTDHLDNTLHFIGMGHFPSLRYIAHIYAFHLENTGLKICYARLIFFLCMLDFSKEVIYRWIPWLHATKIQNKETYHKAGKSVWSIGVSDLFTNKQTRHKRGKKLERFHESKWKLSPVGKKSRKWP